MARTRPEPPARPTQPDDAREAPLLPWLDRVEGVSGELREAHRQISRRAAAVLEAEARIRLDRQAISMARVALERRVVDECGLAAVDAARLSQPPTVETQIVDAMGNQALARALRELDGSQLAIDALMALHDARPFANPRLFGLSAEADRLRRDALQALVRWWQVAALPTVTRAMRDDERAELEAVGADAPAAGSRGSTRR